IERGIAAVVERNHDADGIVWPLAVAPFEVLITVVNPKQPAVGDAAGGLSDALRGQGIDVLLDGPRDRAGADIRDADLVWIPHRLTVGPKGLEEGKVEVTRRKTRTAQSVDIRKAAASVAERVLEERSFSPGV